MKIAQILAGIAIVMMVSGTAFAGGKPAHEDALDTTISGKQWSDGVKSLRGEGNKGGVGDHASGGKRQGK